MRRLAGDDPEVNEEWITDKDRFAFRYARGDDRLTRPLVRDATRRHRAPPGLLARGDRRRRPGCGCAAIPTTGGRPGRQRSAC